jgi:hypothetical protein
VITGVVLSSSPVRAEDAPVVANDGASDGSSLGFFDELSAFLAGNWLDPEGEFWVPRRGRRTELGIFIGGEAGLADFAPSNEIRIPSFGGVELTPVLRLYPVDQVALVVGWKSYLGLEAPASGTGASTVFAPFIGVRYDLIRENRFSLLVDVMSGPAFFVFAGPTELGNTVSPFEAQWALGAEIGAALAARYTLGPTTLETRALVGGRGGSAQLIGRPKGDAGPFSALYAGVDFGITWSFFADGTPPTSTHLQIPADD